MTRFQGGSLLLPCVTLSFTTPRRFYPGAHHGLLRQIVEALGQQRPIQWHRRQALGDTFGGMSVAVWIREPPERLAKRRVERAADSCENRPAIGCDVNHVRRAEAPCLPVPDIDDGQLE